MLTLASSHFTTSSTTILAALKPTFVAYECNEGSLLDEPNFRYPIIAAYAFTFLLCLLGNSFTIIVIVAHRSMRTSTNFFLANLAFADLLVSVFCILQNMFHVVGSANGHWDFGEFLCKFYILILHLVPCTGVGILVCVSLEKYIAVLHPLLALKLLTNKFRVILMAIVWIISIVFNLPYYFTSIEVRYNHLAACTRDMNGYGPIKIREMIAISFVLWFCIPLATMAFLYTRIGMVLWNSGLEPVSIRYNSVDGNETIGAPNILLTVPDDTEKHNGATVCDSNEKSDTLTTIIDHVSAGDGSRMHDDVTATDSVHTDILESRKKIIRLLIAIVCSFAILTLPHHARLLYMMYTEMQMCNSTWTALLQPFTYLCMFLSSSVNPILYAFMSQRFRGAVQDIIKCRICGEAQRKHTRTRTFVSDIPMSRAPSLTHLNSAHQYYLTVTGSGVNSMLLSAADALDAGHSHYRHYSQNSMRAGQNRRTQMGGSVNNLLNLFRRINPTNGNVFVNSNFHKFTRRSVECNIVNNNKPSIIKPCVVPELTISKEEDLINNERGLHKQILKRFQRGRSQYRRRSQSETEDPHSMKDFPMSEHRNIDDDMRKSFTIR